MLVDIALMVLVFAFAGIALLGHVLVLSALMGPAAVAPQSERDAESIGKPATPAKLRFPVTAG